MTEDLRVSLDAHPVHEAPHRGTMAASATETLRELIVIGEIPPGTPLRLEEIADRLGMSISPVREAVRQLAALGLAEHTPYRGARVTPIDAAEMRDVYEARLALESTGVRRTALGWNQEAARLLESALDGSPAPTAAAGVPRSFGGTRASTSPSPKPRDRVGSRGCCDRCSRPPSDSVRS